MQLILPSVKYKQSYLKAVEEGKTEVGENHPKKRRYWILCS